MLKENCMFDNIFLKTCFIKFSYFHLFSDTMTRQGYNLIVLVIAIFDISGTIRAIHTEQYGDCIIDNFSMICDHSIPQTLPRNITGVIVKNYLQNSISNDKFAHVSWSSVDFLDISVDKNVKFRLIDHNFLYLTNVKNLGIHSARLMFISNYDNVLEGLSMLHTLNLSSCNSLNASAITSMLKVSRHLDTLVLDQLATSVNRFLIFDNNFVQMVGQKKIRRLSLSGCNLLIKDQLYASQPLQSLHEFDISNTSIAIQGDKWITDIITNKLFPNLKTLDSSFLQTRFMYVNYEFLDNVIFDNVCTWNSFMNLILRLEHLRLNKILSSSLKANHSFMDLRKCKVNLQSLQVRSNNIHYLNVSLLLPVNSSLFEIDLSFNDLEYLSPSFLGYATSLEIIKVSNNKLYRMESFIEFQNLFIWHKNLKHLDLSKNYISILPFKVFSYNKDLISIDLSFNKLTSVSFAFKHLTKLQFLYLRNNDIHYIDGEELNGLKMLITHSPEHHLKIDFKNNPFVCSCQALYFNEWLLTYILNPYNQSLTCSTSEKDDIIINKSVIKDVEYSCIRSKIIITAISTVLAIIFFASIVTAFIFYKKKQKERIRKRGNFIKDFKRGNLPEKYLCFVSYSSDDDEAQIRQFNARIKKSLQEIIRTDKEVLCENSENFNLGFPIIDEIMRCIMGSCVGIFFVSTNFCQSNWCQLELRETYELNKPIILIFKEEIDERNMSPLMLKIFRKFTRAKIIVREDGQIQIIPNVKQISNSIIKLASLRYDENIDEHNGFPLETIR